MNSIKVLVVDDNVINQKVAVKMLERLGTNADVAFNGLEAVEAVKKQRYDLILMDIQMPEMDGLEATKAIRSIEGTEFHTPIIAITANAMTGDRERCLQAGMDDYFSKPILQKDIVEIIKKWISSKTGPSDSVPEQNVSVNREIMDQKRINQINDIGEASLLHELLTLYLEDLNQYSVDMISAQAANNFQRIYESSHKLKGSSANLGIESLRHACDNMELYAKESDPAKIANQFIAMEEMIEQIRLHIVTTYLTQ